MTIYQIVEKKLQDFPAFRERSKRSEFLAILACRDTGLENKVKEKIPLTFREIADIGIKFDSYRHAWGDVTRDRKDLRGSDYEQGEILEQEKLLELGFGDNRKLKI